MNQITLNVAGKDRTFFFGLMTWNTFTQMRNERAYQLKLLPKDILDIDGKKTGEQIELSFWECVAQLASASRFCIEANRDLMYCALASDCRLNKKVIDFDVDTVGEWLNDMSQQDYEQLDKAALNSKYMGKTLGQWQEIFQQQTQTLAQLIKQAAEAPTDLVQSNLQKTEN